MSISGSGDKAAAPRPVSDEEYRTLAAFRSALRQFLHFSEEAARRAGLTPQKYLALLSVRGFGERGHITVRDLAECLRIRHHSAVGLIDRLVSQGLLVRQPGAGDRRQVFISLTPRGAELLEPLAATHRDQLQRIGSDIAQLLARLR